MQEEQVILVNTADEPTGTSGKMEAHEKGLLHRAFSVFIFNTRGEMLLQQRADAKYHSGGLWTNSCCSHPRPGEDTRVAANRRLKEELGIEVALEKIFDFVYIAKFENGLTEHEFDHVWVGEYEGPVPFDAFEVKAVDYRDMKSINEQINNEPALFTEWFRLAFPRIRNWWEKRFSNQFA